MAQYSRADRARLVYLVLSFSDLQDLYGGVLLQFIAPELHAYTRLLDAAEGGVRLDHGMPIDPGGTAPQATGQPGGE